MRVTAVFKNKVGLALKNRIKIRITQTPLFISISLDAPVMLEFDPESLATTGRKTYKNTITSFGGIELFSTAHPHLQFENNEFVTYNYFLEFRPVKLPGFPASNIAHIAKTDKSGLRKVVGSVHLEEGVIPYVHDFSLTENYAILCVYPLHIDPTNMILSDTGFLRELVWRGDDLVDKEGKIVSNRSLTKIFVFNQQIRLLRLKLLLYLHITMSTLTKILSEQLQTLYLLILLWI
jgi:hypothetical protein